MTVEASPEMLLKSCRLPLIGASGLCGVTGDHGAGGSCLGLAWPDWGSQPCGMEGSLGSSLSSVRATRGKLVVLQEVRYKRGEGKIIFLLPFKFWPG